MPKPADNDTVRVGILGALEVRDESGKLVPVAGPRVRALLSVLALEADRVVPADVLISRLWDAPPPGAANALQSTMSRLRAALRPAGIGVESRPPGYRIALPADVIDALAFERLAADGSTALRAGDPELAARLLRRGLDLWHGPALADLADTVFGTARASGLEDVRRTACLDLAEANLELGGGPELAAELRSLADADPLAERPQALLMRALYSAGRQAEALAVYARARESLAAELGVDPSPELEQTYLAVLRQELPARSRAEPTTTLTVSPDQAVSVRLPAQLTSFVGREKETAQITDLLSGERLVTLTGAGGVGKTRLAVECAARMAETRPHGAWLTELGPLADPAEVPGAILGTLGLGGGARLAGGTPGAGAERDLDPTERLVGALAGRELLLVLDNCEHLVDAAAVLAATVLAGCPRVRILATSREPLGITGEVVYPVPPLDSPPDRGAPGPADILGYPAARLFADRAAAAAGFAVDEGTAPDVARICRALDGIPLAIELAAARLRTLSPGQVAERLGDRFTLLTGGSRTAAARHKTLRAVVDWSWEMLSGPERMLARRLAVFRGGATLEAAQRVCAGLPTGAPDLPREDAVDVLAALVDKSLVIADREEADGVSAGATGQSGAGRRYRMLETIREYCLERLTESGELDLVRRAHAGYFLDLAQTAEPELRRADQLRWMRVLITENENLIAAVRWGCDQRDADLALRLAGALGYFWFLRGRHWEHRPLAVAVLGLAWPGWQRGPAAEGTRSATDRPEVAAEHAWAVLSCAIVVIGQTWDLDRVRWLLLAAIEAAEAGAAPSHPMMVMARPLNAQLDLDFDGALELLGPALDSPDPWVAALALVLRGGILCSQGLLDDAAADCAKAERAFRDLGERWGAASALVQRGYVAGLRGDRDTEITALTRAARFAQEMSAEDDCADLFGQLALARMAAGELDAARADLVRARTIAEQIGHDDTWLDAIGADLKRLTGDLTGARASYEVALRQLSQRARPFQRIRAFALAGLALVAVAEGNLADAAAVLNDALGVAAVSGAAMGVATVLEATAAFCLAEGTEVVATGAGEPVRRAERAATLLGAAHGVRGGADPSHPDVATVTARATRALGQESFDRGYARGRGMSQDDAIGFASTCLGRGTETAFNIGQQTDVSP